MNYRRLASALGVVALAAGLLAIVSPRLAAFDLDRLVVAGVGALALVQAFRVVQRRRHADLDEAATPDPELPTATDPPGEDLESALDAFLDTRRTYYQRSRLREGLRSAALAVLTQYGGYTEADAEAALEAGTWTDDRTAALFLGAADLPTLPVRDRVRNWLRREPPLERSVRHTIDAIASVAGLAPRPSEEPAEPTHRDPPRTGSRTDRSSARPTQVPPEGREDESDDGLSRETHSTGHWRGVSVVALVGIGVGLLVGEPAVLLAGVVGIGFAAYARSSALPPGGVTVSRTFDVDRPEPGEDVEVTVTVTNDTDRLLPDLRLVDGVPESLAVTDGSPRLGTALRPGAETTFSYTVTARRGVHPFDPALLVARDLTGAFEQERWLGAETTLTCIPSLRPLTEPVPLRERATPLVGQVETPSGGDGLEFYATREYRRGDPLSRIDWNRRARTGELTTVEFRQERAASVAVLVDARGVAYRSPEPYAAHAVDRAVDAAGRLFATLSASGDRVGLAALSSEECWLAPGNGTAHRLDGRDLLATHPALSPVPRETHPSMVRWWRQLRRRLPTGTQVVFVTPLCDPYGIRFAQRLEAYGYPVTVLSPDPTADRTPANRLARVARALRMSTLRASGVPVVDWPPDQTVDGALARYDERWSQ